MKLARLYAKREYQSTIEVNLEGETKSFSVFIRDISSTMSLKDIDKGFKQDAEYQRSGMKYRIANRIE